MLDYHFSIEPLEVPSLNFIHGTSIAEGSPLFIQCYVNNPVNVLSYSWFFGIQKLSISKSDFLVQNSHRNNAGEYRCGVNSLYEQQISERVVVNVECEFVIVYLFFVNY